MSAKRTITACWLLLVYLLTAVGPACASLTCDCAKHRAGAEVSCCAHHLHHTHHHAGHGKVAAACLPCEALEHAPAWNTRCCDDRHSTDIELYTNGDDDRTDRLAALPALPLPSGEWVPTAPAGPLFALRGDRTPEPLCHGSVRCTGAHAPPVCA